MKKSFLLLIVLAFISIFLNNQSAQAMMVDEEGTRWWTVNELLQTTEEMSAILEERCGGDSECIINETNELINSDGKYLAANILDGMTFVITEINPSNNSIKVRFNGDDNTMKWNGLKPKVYELNKLRIILIEDESVDSLIFQIEQEEDVSGWSEIYNYAGGETPIKDKTEVELSTPESVDLFNNGYGLLEYRLNFGRFSTSGFSDYSMCIHSKFYSKNVSCRLIISEYSGITYGLYEQNKYIIGENLGDNVNTSNDERSSSSDDDKTLKAKTENVNAEQAQDESTIQNATTSIIYAANGLENETGTNDDVSISTDTDTSNTDNIEIPNSGNNCENNHFSFPWWFLVLLVLLDILLVWWWMPNKNIKKVKKS